MKTSEEALIGLPNHLGGGGHISHTDIGALVWAKKELGASSILDIGCGLGEQVNLAYKLGYNKYIGLDGDWNSLPKQDNFLLIDFTMQKCKLKEKFDLAWSVEFLEHVEEQYICNYMPAFLCCKYIIITHALPGTGGRNHVNCKNSEYWKQLFKSYNIIYSHEKTIKLKENSTMKREFIRSTGMLFVNTNV